jgi:hypothetical protein
MKLIKVILFTWLSITAIFSWISLTALSYIFSMSTNMSYMGSVVFLMALTSVLIHGATLSLLFTEKVYKYVLGVLKNESDRVNTKSS